MKCLFRILNTEIFHSFKIRIFFIFLLWTYPLFPFEILQKTGDCSIVSEGEIIKELSVSKGELKLLYGLITYEVFPETKLNITNQMIVLQNGIVRLHGKPIQSLKIDTPVSHIVLEGSDFIVHYDSLTATSTVQSIQGSVQIQGLYREESITVKSGETGSFVGVLDGNRPTFDILLNGGKAVRGELKGPEKISESDKIKIQKQYEIKKKIVKKIIKPKPKPGEICQNPGARFNECVWRCDNHSNKQKECLISDPKVKCLRERCLANGKWGDTTQINGKDREHCLSNPYTLDVCDY